MYLTPESRSGAFRAAVIGLALAFISLAALPAGAANILWTNPAGGSSTSPFNWSSNPSLPGPLDLAQFNLNSAFNVSWASPVESLSALNVTLGRPRFNIAGRLGVAGQVIVNPESLTVLSGLMVCGHFLVGSGATGRMMLTGFGSQVWAQDSTSGCYLGDGGTGKLSVLGGSRVYLNGWADLGFSHSDLCSLTVAGRSGFPTPFSSGLSTLSSLGGGYRGDLVAGDSGHAYVYVENGGLLGVAGDLFLGKHSTGSGYAFVGNTPTGAFTPALSVGGDAYVGANDDGTTAGSGRLDQTRGTVTITGTCHVSYGTISVSNIGSFNAGGLTLLASHPQSFSSRLLVTNPGAQATISGPVVIGDGTMPSAGEAAVELDSSSTFNSTGPAPITVASDGQVVLLHGSSFHSASELDLVGYLLVNGTLTAPSLRLQKHAGHYGYATGYGTITARTALEDSTMIGTLGGGAGEPALTVGDSTATDGFVSHGTLQIVGDTLILLDKDGADLGNVLFYPGYTGDLRVPNGSRLGAGYSMTGAGRVRGDFTNEGTMSPLPTLEIAGHLTQLTGSTTGGAGNLLHVFGGGSLTARGSANCDLHVEGHLDLGPVPAKLTVGGEFVTTAVPAATTKIRVGSVASGLQDTIVVTGQASPSGALELHSIQAHLPVAGDTLTILTAGSMLNVGYSPVTLDGQSTSGIVNVIYGTSSVRLAFLQNATGVKWDEGAPPAAPIGLRPAGSLRAPAFALHLPFAAWVKLAVYDVAGREVALLHDGALAAGEHQIKLPDSASDGVYFARATVVDAAGTHVKTARGVRLR